MSAFEDALDQRGARAAINQALAAERLAVEAVRLTDPDCRQRLRIVHGPAALGVACDISDMLEVT